MKQKQICTKMYEQDEKTNIIIGLRIFGYHVVLGHSTVLQRKIKQFTMIIQFCENMFNHKLNTTFQQIQHDNTYFVSQYTNNLQLNCPKQHLLHDISNSRNITYTTTSAMRTSFRYSILHVTKRSNFIITISWSFVACSLSYSAVRLGNWIQ